MAEIDLISGGRLVPGWVRGAGPESLANNNNPAFNRERFNEAHDFVINAWTKPGPYEQKPGARPLPASGKRDPVVGEAMAAA